MPRTTEEDVTLDVIAALDMYEGMIGDDGVIIDQVRESPDGRNTVRLWLSNGEVYDLRVREVIVDA